jgi:hypothetical protein
LPAATRCATGLLLGAALCSGGGCAVGVGENIWNSPERRGYPGYSISYVDATPTPGTPLYQGAVLTLTVQVRYTLMRTERGQIALRFRDRGGNTVLPGSACTVPIERTGVDTMTLARDIVVPSELWDLFVEIAVVPEGYREVEGVLHIRYPVARPK